MSLGISLLGLDSAVGVRDLGVYTHRRRPGIPGVVSRPQHLSDGQSHFDWVQWRNEGFIWFVDNGLVKKGTLQGTGIPIPLVQDAQLSARFRLRVDPVYYMKPHYEHLYDSNHQKDFGVPERDFRDLYVDLNHGEVGPGRLSTRWGYQQIVWGESDLYRSLDIINPLRIDQNLPLGRSSTSFASRFSRSKRSMTLVMLGSRSRTWALSRFFAPLSNGVDNLLFHDGWRIEYKSATACRRSDEGPPLQSEQLWKGGDQIRTLPAGLGWGASHRHPWELPIVGNNSRIDSADYACLTSRCAPDVARETENPSVQITEGE